MKVSCFSATSFVRLFRSGRITLYVFLVVFVALFSFAGTPGMTYAADNGTSATLDTSNLEHAYDDSIDTSANIFTKDGHIVYRIDTIGVFPGAPVSIIMNAADNGQYSVTVEGLDTDGTLIPGSAVSIDIDGHKGGYLFTIPAGAVYIRIRGIEGAALYIYDISVYDPYSEDGRFRNANNLLHAFDGSNATSANIFDESGYITYFLNTEKLHPGMQTSFTMNGADGNFNSVEITAYSFEYILTPDTAAHETKVINIDGIKNSYSYDVPAWAAWLKISGIPNTALYIYEIAERQPEVIGDRLLHANNPEHAFDGSFSTSANVLKETGYLMYLLNRMQLHPGMKARFTMNTPDGSPAEVTFTAYSVDYFFADAPSMQETFTVAIDGIKNTYEVDIPGWAALLKISGLPGGALYIYEIEAYDPILHFPYVRNANNLTHAYDGNELTSANIFDQSGYAVFDVAAAGITPGTPVRFMMNGADGLSHDVTVEALDWNRMLIPGSTRTINVSGYKPLTDYDLPAGAAYLKVHGIDGTALYIFEIFSKIDTVLSSVSAANNADGTFTLSLSVKDEMGNGISGLTMTDIKVFIAGINTWDTLLALHNGSYWNIDFQDLGGGDYDALITRTGSLPYSRSWTVRVLDVEIGAVAVTVS